MESQSSQESNSHNRYNKNKKQQGALNKFAKNNNKVGCLVKRLEDDNSLDASGTSNSSNDTTVRPLSMQITPNAVATPLRRCSSVSGENFLKPNGTENENDNKKIVKRSNSHESILHEKNKSSMDSLARRALLAAQVLHLIPTVQARERNFLQGRVAANSLLGSLELERVFPERNVTIFVGTWNMNGKTPPKDLDDFVLPTGIEHVPDILVIGSQESSPERTEWEISLQETLGPTHVLFHSAYLGTIHLAVFLRRDLVWYCSLPEDVSLSVRPGTAFRTKGAVAISFMLFGTSFLFVTAHLTAHQEKVKERVADIKKITRSLDLPKILPIRHKSKDVTQNFDCVFWCGDLNFRLSQPRDKVLEWIEKTEFPLPAHLPHGYMHTDQLKSVLADGAALKGFNEANITFPPTYKYDPGTHRFDSSSKQRCPAYTDRILYKWKTRRASHLTGGSPIQCLVYDSVHSITTSDHKPVWGVFQVQLRPGLDTIPLNAGLFNRDVYLEGIRRRAKNMHLHKNSAVCALQ